MTNFAHRTSRVVDQTPAIVHDRVLELAARLRDEAPPIEPGTQAATLLGVSGPLGIEVADRGPGRIEARTTQGRVRGSAAADIAPASGGGTNLAFSVLVEPKGMAANLMLGVAFGARPNLRQEIVDGLERGFTDLAHELEKPDGEWDASAWQPPGLP